MLQASVRSPSDILDLGCGTGQCGLALADIKRRLVGVDLSPKMLALAQAHGVYDELHAGEVNAWLSSSRDSSFDVIVASDVFIYIGALEDVFRDVARVLRPHGVFAFSIEEHDGAPHSLRSSGRYAHSHAYIIELARTGFAAISAKPCVIRTEGGAPIPGGLYVLAQALEAEQRAPLRRGFGLEREGVQLVHVCALADENRGQIRSRATPIRATPPRTPSCAQ